MEKIKILYVDDEELNLMLLKLNFRDKYNVVTADNAIKGLELLRSDKDISVVISDMKMPEISGLEFIKEAKEKHSKIKYFILTGLEVTPEINTALNDGLIIDYFKKPFIPDSIEKAINKALSNE